MKKIVIPGEFLTDKIKKIGDNVYLENNKLYSSVLGLLIENDSFISVVPLNGKYLPKRGDGIVGIIKQKTSTGYVIDINTYNDCFFPKSLLKKELDEGTVLFVEIKDININDQIDLYNLNLLPNGFIMNVPSVKVPRLLGKNESMLNILKKYTNSKIVIGKNGWIWYKSENKKILEKAIKIVINNSQKSNLTNYIEEYLKKKINIKN